MTFPLWIVFLVFIAGCITGFIAAAIITPKPTPTQQYYVITKRPTPIQKRETN